MSIRFNNFTPTGATAAANSQLLLGAENSLKAMGLLDELKGIVIDQQRAIRERDAKIGTLQQQYDTLNASYWTVLQRLRSYDHIFSLLTKPVKATGETDDKVETAVENGDSSAEPKEESKATPFSLASLKSEALSPLLKLAAQQQQAQQQQQQQQQQHEENKPNALDTIKSFGLERFSGVSMMAGMNGLVNGKSNGKTVSHRATHHGDMTPKTAEGNKPYICKVCGRRFTDRSNCIKHQFIHTGLKPFECPHCGKRFRRKDHLNSHSKSQHGEEAFPPGVPAPRLSIVAATQALPNVIGNRLSQNGQATNHQTNPTNQAQAAIQAAAAAFMMSNSLNSSNSEPSPDSHQAKRLKMESDDDKLVIEEWNDQQQNGDNGAQVEELENKMSDEDVEIDTELPCKIEPTESADLTNAISKEAFERTMAE